MGLFNKLKNILFEEEEIEEEVTNQQPHQRKLVKQEDEADTMEFPKISRDPEKKEKEKVKDYDFEEETDKELFEAERTFDFPAFDEEEFEDLLPKKEEKKEEKPRHRESIEDKYKKDLEPSKRRDDYISVRVEIPKEEVKKLFKPSPVISPVYGILDKNYKKEDILTRDEKLANKKLKLDVDSVRKKAFGALEENLDTAVSEAVKPELPEEEPTVTYYEETVEKVDDNEVVEAIEEEKIDNLLEEMVDEEIDVTKEMELPSRREKTKLEEVEEELEEVEDPKIEENDTEENDLEKIQEEMEENIEEENENEENTEENDLFELIDSMYENKEDE